jgi:hypothetical protein
MQSKIYTNRYGDKFTFTETEDGNILWEGNFKWCRFAWPNVYDKAYEAYCADTDTDERITIGEFEKAVHEYNKETFEYSTLSKKYTPLVYSDTKKISMVDPSGGPYVTTGMPALMFIPKMKGKVVGFEPIETGYKMIIE